MTTARAPSAGRKYAVNVSIFIQMPLFIDDHSQYLQNISTVLLPWVVGDHHEKLMSKKVILASKPDNSPNAPSYPNPLISVLFYGHIKVNILGIFRQYYFLLAGYAQMSVCFRTNTYKL